MTRTVQEIFDHHQAAFESVDLDELMADYADDAVMVLIDQEFVGKAAIRGFFEGIFEGFPGLKVAFEKTNLHDDLFILQYSGEADNARLEHGVATFIIKDDRIQRQTEWFSLIPK
jgi:ketosteroid isomerase-like protein